MNTVLFLISSLITIINAPIISKESNLYIEKTEIIQMRTENQKVYKLEDGSFEMRYYASPIHYHNGNQFVEFQNDISLIENTYISKKDNYEYRISNNSIELIHNNINKISLKEFSNSTLINKNSLSVSNSKISNDNYHFFDTNTSFSFNKKINSINDVLNYKYTLQIDKLNVIGNDFTFNNELVYSLGRHYLKSSNGLIVHSSNLNIDVLNSNEVQVNVEFNKEVLGNNNFIAPFEMSAEIMYFQNEISNYINDKYFINQTTYTYDGNSLFAGKDALQIANQYGHLIQTEYVGVYEIKDLSYNNTMLESDHFHKATIKLQKRSNSNVNLNLYKLNNNISYNSINGTSNINKTFIDSGVASNLSYSFDITDELKDCIDENKSLITLLYGVPLSGNIYADIYSTNSNSDFVPYLSINLGSLYGSAFTFDPNLSYSGNCFNYVLAFTPQANVDASTPTFLAEGLSQFTIDKLIQKVNEYTLYASYDSRHINNYDSAIYPEERRIVILYNLNNSNKLINYHFLMQHNNGYWSGSFVGSTPKLENVYNPLLHSQNTAFQYHLYFAIKER